jgi:hypothetical protein
MSTIEAETPTTTSDEQPPVEAARVNVSSAVAEMSRVELVQWNAWVHVGDGAEDCALAKATSAADYKLGAEIPLCTDSAHFHAWLRLPNPLQRRDLVDKARAGRARKSRELRDRDSDAAVIIEDELDAVKLGGDTELLVNEIVDRNFQEDLVEATNEVMDIEADDTAEEDAQGETPMLYEHIDQDIEELRRQDALPEDQREGYEKLRAHIDSYHEAIDERLKAIQDRRRDALRESGMDHMLSVVRADRVELICTEHYIHVYSMWQWYTCTYKPKAKGTPNERVWGDVNHMAQDASPEVIGVIRQTFDELDRNLMSSRRAKNS